MKRYHRLLALCMLMAMLVCAAPALAEDPAVANAAPAFRQAGSALSVYSGPDSKSGASADSATPALNEDKTHYFRHIRKLSAFRTQIILLD